MNNKITLMCIIQQKTVQSVSQLIKDIKTSSSTNKVITPNKFIKKSDKLTVEKIKCVPKSKEIKRHQNRQIQKTSQTNNKQNKQALSLLYNSKKQLIDELRIVDKQIRKFEGQRIKSQEYCEDIQSFEKAGNLVSKMNHQRKIANQNKDQQNKKLQIKVKKSLQNFEILKKQLQERKEEKKKKISERMRNRQQKSFLRMQLNKKSDVLVKQIKDCTNNCILPYISSSQNKTPQSQKLFKSNNTQSPKISPFLELVKWQEDLKKREEYLRKNQPKVKKNRQQLYNDRIRNGNKKFIQKMFITQHQ